MRSLTVKRQKSFLRFLNKVKLYIEDNDGNTVISGVKCRFLGKLKNGESATFEIDNVSRRLFAIYYKFAKSFCSDLYRIPDSEEDIVVTGGAIFNLTMGNPFLFNQRLTNEVIDYRYRVRKKSRLIMMPLYAVAFIAGFIAGYYLWPIIF